MSSPPQRQTFSFLNLIASIRGANTHGGATSPAPSGASGASSSGGGGATANRPYSSVAAAAAASQSNAVPTPTNQTTTTSSSSSPSAQGTTPTSPVARPSTTTSITIPIPRRRGSHCSDGSTGGYIERPGPPMYIGGKLETGEVKFYKLGLMRAKMSDTSLDRMSL